LRWPQAQLFYALTNFLLARSQAGATPLAFSPPPDCQKEAAMPQTKLNDLPAAAAPPGSLTYWDRVNLARWGAYLIQREQSVVLRAHALAQKPGQAVDLGCGSGRWSKLLSDLGWRLDCIDVDSQSLAICKRNVPPANCLRSEPDAVTIPCGSGSSSLLLCIEVAPAIQAPWFLSESHRVLGDQGLLVGVWWNRRSWRWLGWWLKRVLTGGQSAQTFYQKPYSAWRQELRTAGFDVVHEEGFSWAPFGRASDSPLIPLFTRMERLLGLHRWVTLSPWVLFIAKKASVCQREPLP